MRRLYHNPRCSKSREALALVEASGNEFETIRYLDNPPDEATLRDLIAKLDAPITDFVRTNEAEFKELDLNKNDLDADKAVQAILQYPKLLQRPILETEDQAVIGRPPEQIKALLA